MRGEEEGAGGGSGSAGSAIPRFDLGSLKDLLSNLSSIEGKNAWQVGSGVRGQYLGTERERSGLGGMGHRLAWKGGSLGTPRVALMWGVHKT